MKVSLTRQAKRLSRVPSDGTPSVTLNRMSVENFQIVDQWAARGVALQKMAPYLATEMLFSNLSTLVPVDPDWLAYRRAFRMARVGAKSLTAYAVYVKPTAGRDRAIKADEEVLYIRPRRSRMRPIPPEVAILAKYNPWTLSTLPFSPKRTEAVTVTRKASTREIKSIENQRKKDRPQWTKELETAGIRVVQRTEPLKKVDTKVVSDLAFAGMRLEFGYGGAKRVPHWRPSVRVAIRTVKSLFTKKSRYTKLMTAKSSASSWKRWPPKVAGRLAVADLKNFAKFQKRLRVRV